MTELIAEPGVYDLTAEDYHRDPVEGGSLSSTGARKLLEMPPARWRYEQAHPTPPSAAMVLGTAVHTLVLGVGAKVVAVESTSWQTKVAKAAKAEAQAAGHVALLRTEYDRAKAMADAVKAHPVAGALFSPERGEAERVLVWRNAETGVTCRAMVDHSPHEGAAGRHVLVDLKTTEDASPRGIAKSVARYGYDRQAAFYLNGYRTLRGGDPAFLFVFVEKAPPHLVRVDQLGLAELLAGADANRRAMEIYRDCTESGVWPGYEPEIGLISLPAWALDRHLEETR